MYWMDRLMSHVRREVVRTMRKFHNPPRMGTVSSYDKTKHAVKVRFQPEGTESGWIPLTGLAVGNGFGVASGPNVHDPVEVHFQESDHSVARVLTRHWSKVNKPPQVDSGEHVMVHQSGAQVYFKKDGTLLIQGAGSVQTGQQGNYQGGNISTDGSSTGANNNQPPSQTQQPQGQQTIQMDPDGTLTISAPNNDFIHQAGAGKNHWITSDPTLTRCVKKKGNLALPVQLIDGSAALTLMAEPDGA